MNVTVKNIPPKLHRLLKARAKDTGRSLNQEIIVCLSRELESQRIDVEGILRKAAELREQIHSRLSVRAMIQDINEGAA